MARFQREAKVLASLNHPNIATIYGLEDSDSPRALVMELVEGPTLGDRIKAGPIPVDEAVRIARQIADALEYAHERGIIHRDLKPASVKVSTDDTVKILDFGLAKAIEATAEPAQSVHVSDLLHRMEKLLEGDTEAADIANSPTLSEMATRAGILLGTAGYMSPEQAKGRSADRRADNWAFGCVLYEMLTGKSAFSGESVTDTLAAVIKEEPDWSKLPAATPKCVRALLQRCLQKDAKQRLRDIGEARISLEEVLSGAPEATRPQRSSGGCGPYRDLRAALFWLRRDSPIEYLLFVRGAAAAASTGTLMAQAFDNRRLELVGDAIPIADHVSNVGFSASAAGALAYVNVAALAGGGNRMGSVPGQLTWFDQKGNALGTAGDLGTYGTLALSPDGKRVAFGRADPRNPALSNIWLYEFARGVTTRFTFDSAWDANPVWSPDGRRIAFGSNRGGRIHPQHCWCIETCSRGKGLAGLESRFAGGPREGATILYRGRNAGHHHGGKRPVESPIRYLRWYVFGLHVDDLELENVRLRVRRSVWKGQELSVKTKNGYRVIHIDPALVEMLRQHLGNSWACLSDE
jgi:hypothetical protein